MTQPPGFPGPYQQNPGGYPPQPGPPGYPQQGAHPQQGGYGPQGPYGGPPKKSPLPWILGGVGGLLVVGGAVTAIILLTGGDDDGDNGDGGGSTDMATPQAVANAIAGAVNSKDVDALLALTCTEFRAYIGGNKADLQEDIAEVNNVSVKGVQEQGPDAAEVTMSFTEQGETQPEDEKFNLAKRDGKWTWCESVPESSGGPDSGPGGSPPTFSQGPPPQAPDPN